MTAGFQGDVDSPVAWQALEEDPEAVLIDVRSAAEWEFVGVPDLSRLGRVRWSGWRGRHGRVCPETRPSWTMSWRPA